jgi:TPR repeat protein
LALLLSLWPGLALAGVAEGVAAYARGDYAAALAEFRPLADAGEPLAQFNLGVMYKTGRGVKQDPIEAYKWFELAASRFEPGLYQDDARRYRDLVGNAMSPEDVRQARERVRSWRPRR